MGAHRVTLRSVAREPWLAFGRIACECGWEHDVGPFMSIVEADDATDAAWERHVTGADDPARITGLERSDWPR